MTAPVKQTEVKLNNTHCTFQGYTAPIEGFHWPDNWRQQGEQASAGEEEGEEAADQVEEEEEEEEDEGQPLSVSGGCKVTSGFSSVHPNLQGLGSGWVLGSILDLFSVQWGVRNLVFYTQSVSMVISG